MFLCYTEKKNKEQQVISFNLLYEAHDFFYTSYKIWIDH